MNSPGTPSQKRSERMVALLSILDEHGQQPLSYLAQQLGASEATIRRDVATLATQGLLERTHGGARPSKTVGALPVRLRDGRNQEAKVRIAVAAARMIPKGKHAIGLTGGTTTAEVLRACRHRDDLTIITNSITIGLEAAEQGRSRVLIAGGILRSNSLELVGSLTESTLRLVDIQTAFVGADGISASGGITTHDDVEARTNRALIERARHVVAVADGSKIGHITQVKVVDLCDVHALVTDSSTPPHEIQRLQECGLKVHVVPAGEPVEQ